MRFINGKEFDEPIITFFNYTSDKALKQLLLND